MSKKPTFPRNQLLKETSGSLFNEEIRIKIWQLVGCCLMFAVVGAVVLTQKPKGSTENTVGEEYRIEKVRQKCTGSIIFRDTKTGTEFFWYGNAMCVVPAVQPEALTE